MKTAHAVKAAGATILRGGAFKPRTSPYEFQGLGRDGLRLLALAKKETGLKIITELLSENHVDEVAEHADILQIGARNAQNFQLLIAAAASGKPILLKRGLSERIDEWLRRESLEVKPAGAGRQARSQQWVAYHASQRAGERELVTRRGQQAVLAVDDVLGDHGRVLPLWVLQRRRYDVFRIAVELVGELALT